MQRGMSWFQPLARMIDAPSCCEACEKPWRALVVQAAIGSTSTEASSQRRALPGERRGRAWGDGV